MIGDDGEAILIDFGVSMLFDNNDDEVTSTAGTMSFFAPEMTLTSSGKPGAVKKIFGRKADIWAFGVTLF